LKQNSKYKYKIISALSIIGFFMLWQLATDVLHIVPVHMLPSPLTIAATFVEKLSDPNPDGSVLIVHIITSLQIAAYGFLLGAVIGVPLGIFMAWYKKIDMLVKPVFDLVRTIPPIGWIPIMILWFGIGIPAKAAIVFLSAFIPCVINSYSGIKQTSPVHIWVAQTFGASNTTILGKVAIPTALPMIFTGLKLSLNSAWTTLVAAELLGATSGLGYMMQMARMLIRPDIIVVGMLTIGVIGILMSAGLDYLEIRFVKGGN